MSIKQKIRFLFWGSLSVASYVLSLILLFKNQDLLFSFIPIFVFFISFHFFYLEISKLNQKYVLGSILVWVIATWFLMTDHSIVMRIANIAFHATIWRLSHSLYWETEGTTGFDWFTYFSSGGYLFTMMLSLVYSIFVVYLFSQFPLDCTQLNEKSDKIIEFVAKPLRLSWDKTQQISSWFKSFLSAPTDTISLLFNPEISEILWSDALGGSATELWLEDLDTKKILNQLGIKDSGSENTVQEADLQNLLSSLIASLWIDNDKEKSAKDSVDEKNQKLKNAINSLKQNLVTNPIQDNEKLNSTICEVTLNAINERMKSPSIQYSVIFMILLLIYPFLRIILRAMSFVSFFIFEFCYLVGVYTKVKETREVDRIG
jgi:hypothetical protein